MTNNILHKTGIPEHDVYPAIGDAMDTHMRQILGEIDHAELDPYEFAAKRIWIADEHGKTVRLKANFLQREHQRTKEIAAKRYPDRPPHYLTLKYRKGGLTTWEQMLSYRAVNTIPNAECTTLAHTRDDTQAIFRMVRKMALMDDTPHPGLWIGTNSISVPQLHTIFSINTAGAKAPGRGLTPYRVHGSEVAFWPGKYEEIDNLVAGITESARYREVVFETTANGANGYFYENYKEAMEGKNLWIPLFYPWYIDPSLKIDLDKERRVEMLDTLTEEEKEIMEAYDLSLSQMAWRRMKKMQRKKLFPQEYPETWQQAFVVRGSIFFDEWDFDELERNCDEPLEKTESDSVTIWENPKPGEEYVMGADAAEGNSDSDFSVGAMLNKKTGNQAMVLRGRWTPDVFGKKCIKWCEKYNNAIFGCELNNHGHSVMNTVVNTLNYKHLYWHEKEIDKKQKGRKPKDRKPGWLTSSSTRAILLDELHEAVRDDWMKVNDPILVSEARTFVDVGGKFQADEGQHDDTVLAWGIAQQVKKQKKVQYVF